MLQMFMNRKEKPKKYPPFELEKIILPLFLKGMHNASISHITNINPQSLSFPGTHRGPVGAVTRGDPAAMGEPPAAERRRHAPLHQLPAGCRRLRDLLVPAQTDRA